MRFELEDWALKEIKEFNIEIYKLANGIHKYNFEVKDSFFEHFENSLIEKGSALVVVELEKSDTFIKMGFDIQGMYELICDRSLESFFQHFSTHEKVIFKFGPEVQELDDDIYVILKNTQRLNIAQLVYEFISITIPMKKLHPRYENDLENEDEMLIYSSEDEDQGNESEAQEEKDIDPRWLKLKNLKNNNDN